MGALKIEKFKFKIQNSLLQPIYIYTIIYFQVKCHIYIMHTCQATPDIPESPFESQWGSLRNPGQPDMYDHGHIQGYHRINTLHS